jgi:hypothetical protein
MVTLWDDVVSTLNGVASLTLCGLALHTLGDVATRPLWRGLLQTVAARFLIATMCVCLSAAKVGMDFWNAVRGLAALVMVLSCLLTVERVKGDRSNQYVPEIMYPLVAGT